MGETNVTITRAEAIELSFPVERFSAAPRDVLIGQLIAVVTGFFALHGWR